MNDLELGSAKFSHFVENADADPDFRLLVFETPRFQFCSDDTLPPTHLRFRATALRDLCNNAL